MDCEIMTAERWRRLLTRRLAPEEATALRRHMSSNCPACETFFAEMDEGEEGLLQVILRQSADPGERAVEPAPGLLRDEFRSVMRRVKKVKEEPSGRGWFAGVQNTMRRDFVWAGGMAVLLVVIGLGSLLYWKDIQPPMQTTKGVVTALPTLRLEFSVGRHQPGGEFRVERGRLGGRYDSSARLLLRFENSQEGYVYLLSRRPTGEIELVFPKENDLSRPRRPGITDFRDDEALGGISLEGIVGRYAVIGVFSPKPLDPDRLLIPAVRGALDPSTGRVNSRNLERLGEGVTTDGVYIDVGA